MIQLKRVYEEPSRKDGLRVLVERLWPRGLTKERAAVDLWMKELAPSPELRRWYSHDITKWTEFKKRYFSQLKQNEDDYSDALVSATTNVPLTHDLVTTIPR